MRILTILLLIFVLFCPINLMAQSLPQWLVPLREAIYEHRLTANQIVPVYNTARAAARENLSGTALDLALSRCEFFMGRALLFEERNQQARPHFAEGLRLAEGVIQTAPNAEAWVLRAENLAHLCQIGPWSFTVANGLDVDKFAKNALNLNRRNAAAQYLVAARWVFAPAPFHNHRRGIEMMEAITRNSDMQKDDRFNVFSAIGYAYLQQNKPAEARPWVLRAQEIYPSNKFAAELLAKTN